MKTKTYYEILGIAPHVSAGQIQAAYRFARSLYSGEAVPTYGLLNDDERSQMLSLVEEAYAALSNPSARREYDLGLAAKGSRAPSYREPVSTSSRTNDADGGRVARSASASDPTPSSIPPGPVRVPELVNGSVLRSLREERHLTVGQIAALSKVGSRFLKALEDDRHEILPARVFARGFLIEYARAIGVSDTELAERYMRHWTGK